MRPCPIATQIICKPQLEKHCASTDVARPFEKSTQVTWAPLLLFFCALAGLATGANSQQSGLSRADAGKVAARVVILNGRKLYMPAQWSFSIRSRITDPTSKLITRRSIKVRDTLVYNVAKFEAFPGKAPVSQEVEGLGFSLCKVVSEPEPKIAQIETDIIPIHWGCLHQVTLQQTSVTNFAAMPRLGPKAISKKFRDKYLGSLDEHDFRKLFFVPETRAGTYFGFRTSDIAPSGGPIMVTCSRYLRQHGFYCKIGEFGSVPSLAIEGVKARRFRWHVAQIEPRRLRTIYWRSQRLLEWLAMPPGSRPSRINDDALGIEK